MFGTNVRNVRIYVNGRGMFFKYRHYVQPIRYVPTDEGEREFISNIVKSFPKLFPKKLD